MFEVAVSRVSLISSIVRSALKSSAFITDGLKVVVS